MGVFIAVVIEILGVPVLPVAIGLYLPLELSSTIMIGGIIKLIIDKKKGASSNDESSNGILFCSGLIAGEGLVGIILAILAVIGVDSKIDVSGSLSINWIGTLVLLALLVFCVYISGRGKKTGNEKAE